MEAAENFIFKKPTSALLAPLIDQIFFVDSSILALEKFKELALPFPRVTFGYFFDTPFKAKNLNTGETKMLHAGVAKIQNSAVEITPLSKNIKIIGAHLKPYALAHFTDISVSSLPWFFHPSEIFGQRAEEVLLSFRDSPSLPHLFQLVEESFISVYKPKDLLLVQEACSIIEEKKGDLTVSQVAGKVGKNTRTLQNHFIKHIGVGPKEFILLTKIKFSLLQMAHSNKSLTEIAHENNFADQAHFIHVLKQLNSPAPKKLRQALPSFRFLQF
ncbi:MAG: helix-turn-helix transcriptional regulator [Luteibaculaceae bacterium]